MLNLTTRQITIAVSVLAAVLVAIALYNVIELDAYFDDAPRQTTTN